MSDDPNGSRWMKSDSNIGRALLLRGGWAEGSGLGKERDGATTHVKVRQKDGTMGIGYAGSVQETWSTQAVAFADVLQRIKDAAATNNDSDVEEEEAGPAEEKNTNGGNERATGVVAGRHAGMYAKRHALKTELLRSKDGKSAEEILGSASSSRKRGRGDYDNGDNNGGDTTRPAERENGFKLHNSHSKENGSASTLRSPVLQRLMVRVPEHEPRQTSNKESDGKECNGDDNHNSNGDTVHIVKPRPRPPKCTDTPFLESSMEGV
uniref:PinX1-related protein 1 n=1 Tax=Trypanosoma congolense (strain IL3000) TaxID=1068625 RepID=G0UQI6_TRYCI|nr:unnamed protein product [Trypanosoma congolense IL3000]